MSFFLSMLFIVLYVLSSTFCTLNAKPNVYIKHYELLRLRLSKLRADHLRVTFHTRSRTFDFNLTRVHNKFFRIPAFYEGLDNGTFAAGYVDINNKEFTGILQAEDSDELLFLEPSLHYFPNRSQREMIFYREEDIVYPTIGLSQKKLNLRRRTSDKVSSNPWFANTTNSTLECVIEISADGTLHQLLDEETLAFLNLHLRYADFVFRHLDVGPKTMRIQLGNLEYLPEDFFSNRTYNMHQLLMLYSGRLQTYCLSICFTDRILDENSFGMSFEADSNGAFGICSKPMSVLGKYHSFNTGVLTVRNKDGIRLPLGVTLSLFASMIGHSFRNSSNSKCTMTNRTYFFSDCNVQFMKDIVRKRSSCFEHQGPVCGNGIREDVEDCDCGIEEICDLLDPCCYPAGNETGCKLRTDLGYSCSTREDWYCSNNCTYVKDVCSMGHCDKSICIKNKMDDCFCDTLNSSCEICCRTSNGSCVSASTFLEHTVWRISGTPCFDEVHECDDNGQCILLHAKKIEEQQRRHDVLHVLSIALLVVLISTALFAACGYFYSKRMMSDPPRMQQIPSAIMNQLNSQRFGYPGQQFPPPGNPPGQQFGQQGQQFRPPEPQYDQFGRPFSPPRQFF